MENKMNASAKTLFGICLVVLCLLIASLFITGCSSRETENSTTIPQSTPDTTVSGQNATNEPIKNTSITEDAAKGIALSHSGVSEDKAQRFKSKLDYDNGRQVYEIEFDSEGVEYDYEIDAKTGEIVKFDKELK